MSDLYSVGSLVKIQDVDITIKEKRAIKSVNNKILYKNDRPVENSFQKAKINLKLKC